MTIDRRALLKSAAALSAANAMPRLADAMEVEKADYTLRIASGLVELSPEHIVSTTLYNGQFPGPLIRLKEGKRVIVDVYNDTDTPELVHWHGQFIPSGVDGAAEEGTPFVAPHAMRRISFVPKPTGLALLSYPCRRRRRSRARHLHGPGWAGLHRAGRRQGRLRPRNISGAQGISAVLQPRRRHGDGHAGRRAAQGAAGHRQAGRRKRTRGPRATKSATNCSASTARCWAMASRSA